MNEITYSIFTSAREEQINTSDIVGLSISDSFGGYTFDGSEILRTTYTEIHN
jgi:hypothetical protein